MDLAAAAQNGRRCLPGHQPLDGLIAELAL
jgi:hypothetical protein